MVSSVLSMAATCGATTPRVPLPETRATLAGPLCSDGICSCRSATSQAGQPSRADHKRFEFRLGPAANELWVTVNDMTLYKNTEQNSQCFYLDLPPGRHKVRLYARSKEGAAAGLAVSEMQTENYWWYQTLRFRCGTPGPCEKSQLARYRKSLSKYRRSVHDPCGSTKVRKIRWDAGRLNSGAVLGYVDFQFELDIRRFSPTHPSGDPQCANRF